MCQFVAVAVAIGTIVAAQEAPKMGSVSGTVVDAQSGEPVDKALVVLTQRTAQVGARTDSHGKFALTDLEPGTYSIEAQRKGYIVARGSQRQLTVAAGTTTTDVTVKLTRTGVVTGRVIDAGGEPMSAAGVQLVPVRRGRAPGNGHFGNTDDRGQFRVFFVAPGEYRAVVVYSAELPYSHVRVQSAGKASDGPQAYPTVYYPGTVDENQAAVIRVEPGSEVSGIDIQLIRAHGVAVRGRVLRGALATGPAGAFVTMSPVGRGRRAGPGRSYDRVVDNGKGDFEFTDVLPGVYRLTANVVSLADRRQQFSAKHIVEVRDVDVEGIELAPGPPAKVTGRFIIPEGRKLPAGLMVLVMSRDPGESDDGGFGAVKADGAFALDEVAAGDYDVTVGSMQPDGEDESDDLYITAIRSGDDDVLADGLHVGATTAPIEIVVKPNGGLVEVSTADEKGAAVPGANVVLRPDPPRERQLALAGNCKTDATGKCRISGITPGAYHCYAFAAEGAEVDARDPDSFKGIEKYGKAVKVGEGEKKSMALTVVPVE